MLRKRFYVKIDLQLHAITCPGVWLCSHGYLEATIKTLGYFFRTGAMEPRFPLLCHDQFTMEGHFKSVGSLEELEKVLAAEQVEITLWQNGRRLAHFLGKLSDVMQQPCLPKLSCMHNVNVQLLLKPSPSFPGIIAPKVELSAQVGVRDRSTITANPLIGLGSKITGSITKCTSQKSSNNSLQTPRFETHFTVQRGCQQLSTNGASTGGSCLSYMKEKRRQRPVCHALRSTNNNFTPATSCHCSNTKSQLESQAQKNDLRRLSICSSHLSNFSYMTLGETSADGSSKCSHSFISSSGGDGQLEIDHQECCKICRLYKKVFQGIIAPKVELSAQVGVRDRSTITANPLIGLGSKITGSITKCTSQKSSNNSLQTPRFETHFTVQRGCQQLSTNGASTGGSCLSYMKEKRRQRPVCHALRSTNNNFTPATSCHCSNTKSQLESQAQKNDLRRLSICSSHLSNFSYMTLGETSADGSSKCSHSFISSSGGDGQLEIDHQECCKICRLYKKVFQVPLKLY